MNPLFNSLFDYNYFCNKQIIEFSKQEPNLSEKVISLFSHILNAHHTWNARILQHEASIGVWDSIPVEKWEDVHYENQRTTFEILSNNENFDKSISYQNSKGDSYSNSLKDILLHIINHSTHHRAQIITLLKDQGHTIAPLDYIFYKRA